jgi:hypothetical protein
VLATNRRAVNVLHERNLTLDVKSSVRAAGSAVGIATGCTKEGSECRICMSPYRPDLLWNPPSLVYKGTGIKRPGREADHSSAEVKRTWIYTSTPPISLYGLVLNVLSKGTTLSSRIVSTRPPLWSSGQSSWLQIQIPGATRFSEKSRVCNGVHSAS